MPLLMCKTMPTSEEFTGKVASDSSNRPKGMDGRKSSKPLMEKRRRARINDSLTQLKTLILEATNKDTSRHSKLEKADILEMTVKYLKNLQRHHIVASLDSEANATRYRMGYSECISEVSRFLSPHDSNLVDLRVQLLNHLAQTCTVPGQKQPQQQGQTLAGGHHPVPASSPAVAPAAITAHIPQPLQIQVAPSGSGSTTVQTVPITVTAQPHTTAIAVSNTTPVPMKGDATTVVPTTTPQQSPAGMARIVSGIQVGIPTGISGGEIALVIPPQAFPNGQVPSHFIPVYSQHAPVLSPSSAAATPTVSQGLSSPVGTATASVAAQLPSGIAYQSVSGCVTATTTASVPSRNVIPGSELPKVAHPSIPPVTNSMSVPIQSFVTLRSPLQTSHHQNQAALPQKVGNGKVKCVQEVVAAMEEDQLCWRPW